MAAQLDRLDQGWAVIHSLPTDERGIDIDHLVIGPPGVFTVNAKFSPGRSVWVAGHNIKVEYTARPFMVKPISEAAGVEHARRGLWHRRSSHRTPCVR